MVRALDDTPCSRAVACDDRRLPLRDGTCPGRSLVVGIVSARSESRELRRFAWIILGRRARKGETDHSVHDRLRLAGWQYDAQRDLVYVWVFNEHMDGDFSRHWRRRGHWELHAPEAL